jgi:hypothetical protein
MKGKANETSQGSSMLQKVKGGHYTYLGLQVFLVRMASMDGATAPVSGSVVFIRQLVALGQTDMAGRAADRGRGRPRRTILSTLEPPNWFTCFV